MIQAFIFDLDGVITDTADLHFRAWKKCAGKLGIDIDLTFNERLKGVDRIGSLERILEFGGKSNHYSLEEKLKIAEDKNDYYKKLILDVNPKDILPGIHSLLVEIKRGGYKIGLASASKNAPTIIKSLEIDEFFDAKADPSTIANSKPAPDIFLQAASILEVEPTECIGIEDASAGIESIKKAGMFAVGVGDPEYLKEADYLVNSTEELTLENMLKAWNLK
ncbi:beta-phosphoglucomutase [Paucisalibacillus globulus]|uniref:beta-phosphoglucomutase n=1 Tax=Paucisalibacillus globulus TaxID=351095 RepID=UPI000BB761AE|nr:beta-phosphoglucomutase [Paucisalibacillus globulus]